MRVKSGSLISIILAVFFVFVSLSHAIEKDAILGIWLFDEEGDVARDSSSNGRDGKFQGDVKRVEGISGGALSFPGDGSRVTIPHDDALTLTTFSITAWIKTDTNRNFQTILGKGAAGVYSYYLMLWQSGQQVNFVEFSATAGGTWVSCRGKTEPH